MYAKKEKEGQGSQRDQDGSPTDGTRPNEVDSRERRDLDSRQEKSPRKRIVTKPRDSRLPQEVGQAVASTPGVVKAKLGDILAGKFCGPCVYFLFTGDGSCVYVGRTGRLKARLSQHAKQGRVNGDVFVLRCASTEYCIQREKKWISSLSPRLNRRPGRPPLLSSENLDVGTTAGLLAYNGRRLRDRSGVNADKCSESVGVSPVVWYRLENAEMVRLNANMIDAIADLFGVSVERLFRKPRK